MLRFILRRVLVAIPLLFFASIVTFLMVTNIGTPKKIEDALAKPGHSATQIDSLRRQFGMDQEPVQRYTNWMKDFLKGDWGKNYDSAEIRSLMWERIQVTVRLLIAASIISVVLGVLVGIVGAIRQYSAFDYFMTFLAFLLFSIPAAVLAGFLKEYGAIKLNPWLRRPSMSTGFLIFLALFGLVAGFLIMRNRYKYERERPPSKYLMGAAIGLGTAIGVVLVFKLLWDGNVYRARNPKPLIPTVGQTTPGFEGAWWVMRHVRAAIVASGGGSVVTVVPSIGVSGGAGFAPLATVAEGLRVLAKGCGRQWAQHGVTANTIVAAPHHWVDHEAGERLRRAVTLSVPAFGDEGGAAGDLAPLVAAITGPDSHFLTAGTLMADGGTWMGL